MRFDGVPSVATVPRTWKSSTASSTGIEGFLGAETNRVGKLLRILDSGDLDRADADAVVRQADAYARLGSLCLRKKPRGPHRGPPRRAPRRRDHAGRHGEAASWTTSAEPLTATHAAFSREAPSLRPTTFLATVSPSASGDPQAACPRLVRGEKAVALEETP